MAIAYVNDASVGGLTGAGPSTAKDLSTANFLFAAMSFDSGTTPSFNDNSSNTWNLSLTTYGTGSPRTRPAFVASPTVNSAQTGTMGGIAVSFDLSGWSGVSATPTDQQTGGQGTSTAPQASGNLTPSEGNCLVISQICFGVAQSAAPTVAAGWMIVPNSYRNHTPGSFYGVIAAYQIQTTATGVNPAWTLDTSADWGVSNTSWKSVGGGGGGGGGTTYSGCDGTGCFHHDASMFAEYREKRRRREIAIARIGREIASGRKAA